ncbi:hypothetical protein FNV43_RR18078 [Rhamnella rubrinervis]|uniref:Uncharacterized protein n=1 Tax=Rhamnella rubrinervis TaxID=2594499 RepID=A0A8K0E5J4_9ROSA|nr:hypothetical protein FNV43_RR18078 [Rhamnella rubrinervis]
MWMWAVSCVSQPIPYHSHPLIPRIRHRPPLCLAVSANSQPPGQDIGGLGHTILTAIDSNTKPTIPIPNPDDEEDGRQISGSDVLWALQKAAAHKKKKKKNKKKMNKIRKGPSSQDEEVAMDYSNIRPLCIKSDWGGRLDELEKRLQELSETI